jgi:anthranilate phosphoribosyltransferase
MAPADPPHLQPVFAALLAGRTLPEAQAEAVFAHLLSGGMDAPQIGALLALLAARPPCVDELVGAARAMRRLATPVAPPPGAVVIDTCGTGGAPKLFNVSTVGALVTAAAARGKAVVAKHGNRSRTGRGSAELLEALGVNIHAPAAVQARCLREVGVCFSFAPAHHPAAAHASAARRSLAFPTLFNLLGPLANPAGATRQLVGTSSPVNARALAGALARLGTEHALVVTSDDGLDELTTTAPNLTFEVRGGQVAERALDAVSLGLARAHRDHLCADSLEAAAQTAQAVLDGQPGPCADMVVLNAGASLMVAGIAPDLAAGVALAREALASGAAARTLDGLRRLSHEPA